MFNSESQVLLTLKKRGLHKKRELHKGESHIR